ncbi:zinc-binding alcohol dehydrogenase family protein [Acinetobacter soli]|uniref:zinc-binding alcohol dehydrogenase family protein n=1 Tax=Acinetobacter soli TaxID=487316 RepID=UPI003A872949
MKAVGYKEQGEITRPDALVDIEIEQPVARGKDILVEVKAISVNPVDTKVRKRAAAEAGQWKILGWDAAGVVVSVGDEVTEFKVGDEVWYAGDLTRPGSNAQFQLVDARIVGHKPKRLSFAEAAAMPLTTITAWEMLFDRLKIEDPVPGGDRSILIIGGAGGVGSITIQLLKAKSDLKVIATASRAETQVWVKQLGADYVIDHSKPLKAQMDELGLKAPSYVFSTNYTDQYMEQIAALTAPQGRLGLIDDPAELNISPLKTKSISLHWEFMYTRSMYQTEDIAQQRELLNAVAKLVDDGVIQTTLTEVYGKINAENLKEVHNLIEGGKAKGKIVLEGF